MGWEKSSAYFISTFILRHLGLSPTVIISPLLVLMRNQIAAAKQLDVCAVTINSSSMEEWTEVKNEALTDRVDVVLISPECLAAEGYRLLAGLPV
jgi:ATP-dependent DNA helicase RecQ